MVRQLEIARLIEKVRKLDEDEERRNKIALEFRDAVENREPRRTREESFVELKDKVE